MLYRVSVPYCTVSAYALCLPLLFVCTVFSSTTQHVRKKEERKGRKDERKKKSRVIVKIMKGRNSGGEEGCKEDGLA